MKKTELYRLIDLIEKIKKLDELITLHRQNDPSDFMISQYEAKRTKLVDMLVEKPYDQAFVDKVLQGDEDFKAGKGKKMTVEELNGLLKKYIFRRPARI